MPEHLPADAALAAIQGHFHQLIASRAHGLVEEQQLELPVIAGLTASKDEPAWFPVPGMYGGFAYWLEPRDEGIALISESWIRVVEGSGQRHEITAYGCRLVAEGFV